MGVGVCWGGWAVNLSDTAAFSATNESLKGSQSELMFLSGGSPALDGMVGGCGGGAHTDARPAETDRFDEEPSDVSQTRLKVA